jgi:hypothetical protein
MSEMTNAGPSLPPDNPARTLILETHIPSLLAERTLKADFA